MLYYIFRFFLWIMYVCFYRRVYYLHADHIPSKGSSVIFVSNHSNGLMDPVLVAAMQARPVYFWVAAGEIPSNFLGKLMEKLHSIPIYRAKEGRDKMHKNKESFRITKEHLYTGWSSMWIAPEGVCRVQKRLEPLKKGTARLAFEMMEEKEWKLDLQILPTGVNYTNHLQFRSEVYVNLGQTIAVKEYQEQFLENKEKAIVALTKKIEQGIRQQMIYIEKQDVELTEAFLPLLRNNFKRRIRPLYSTDAQLCEGEQHLATAIGQADNAQKKLWATQLQEYKEALAKEQLSDFAIAHQNKRSIAVLLLGFPFWLMGTVIGYLPHKIASAIRNKLVPFPAFSTSFAFVAAFFVWLIWAGILTGIGIAIVGWLAVCFIPMMILLQTFAYHYTDYSKEWYALFCFNRKKTSLQQRLQEQRRQLPFMG